MSARISERIKIDVDVYASSSAAQTSKFFDMSEVESAAFVVALGPIAANSQYAISLLQSGDKLGATNATVTNCNVVAGSTAATLVTGARSILITASSASTDGNTIQINGTTFTQSTANSATALQFGSTAGSTSAAGLDDIVKAIVARVNSYMPNLIASTVSTSQVRIQVRDNANTSINCTCSANHTPSYESVYSVLEVRGEEMNSTSRYLGVQISTGQTAVAKSITVIRGGNRYGRVQRHGQSYKTDASTVTT